MIVGNDFLNEELMELMRQFTSSVEACLVNTLNSIIEYVENGENERVRDLSKKAHIMESRADKYRRDIVDKLIKDAFAPDSRRELMSLVENIDNVADGAEEILDSVIFIGVDLSILDVEELNDIAEMIKRQYTLLKDAILGIFTDVISAASQTSRLQQIEAHVDRYEEKIIRQLCTEDVELAHKIVCQKIVKSIADLADIIENAGDDISVIAVLRKV